MRFSYEFAMEEYKKVKKYLDRYQCRCEVTGSLRRKKEDIGDIDIVVKKNKKIDIENLKELETEVLEIISKYSEVERRINHYEFLLKSGISIHMIPEISKHFNYTLWHSTGPKHHVKLIKDIYEEKGMEIDMENTEEKRIYENINLKYIEPEKRWEFTEDYQKETEAGIKGEKSYDKKTKSKKNNSCTS
jgi:DNA polymerase/3'-5' exonuclease PolX